MSTGLAAPETAPTGPLSDWMRVLFEAIDDAVFVHDEQGNILEANPAACRRLGYTREEMLRLNTREIDAPEFAAGFGERLQSQLHEGHFRCEGVHRTKDGRLIPVDINTSSIRVNGTPAVLAVIRDITRRKQIESALYDSEALYHSLVQNLPQNIFRKDRAGRFTFGNQRYCETVKVPLDKLLGKTDFDLFPRELASKYVEDDRRILETGRTVDTVEEHHLPEGDTIYVHVVKTPVLDAKGAAVGVQGIFWDVTEQVRAEQGLAQSEHRYRQLTEATLDGIALIDETGCIDLFNPAAERLFGYAASDVLGEPASLLVPEEFGQLCAKGTEAYFESRVIALLGQPIECKGRRKDGSEFPIEIALSVLADPPAEGKGPTVYRFLAALRDLTERNKMRSVLVQNEKLASIGLLSAGVAHEINNPLAFVANNLVVLERDFKGLLGLIEAFQAGPEGHKRIQGLIEEMDLPYVQENLGRMLARTRDGVERVTRIVHSLRGLARTEAPRRQETSISDLIDGSLEIVRGRFKRLGVDVQQDHDPNPSVPCVSTQIGQVILNLLVNAFQAIESCRPEGGVIHIRTRRGADEFALEIADNGCGIPKDVLPRLFDPFFTTKDVGEGTGLGLSISHHTVTAHGGRIEVESTHGAGTCFRVVLPLKERKDKP